MHPCILHNRQQNPQLTKHDRFIYLSSSCPVRLWATAKRFADAPQDCSTSEAFSTRTVQTENIHSFFLNGPESAHKNGIIKTFTHTSIPIHPCTLLKQRNSKTLKSLNMTPLFTGPLPVECGGGRRPGSSAPDPQDCSTSKAFFPRTVLAENICRSVQNILQYFPTTMPFLTTPTITFSCQA